MLGRTHIHRTKIVTIMSRLPASGLDEKAYPVYDLDFFLASSLLPVDSFQGGRGLRGGRGACYGV